MGAGDRRCRVGHDGSFALCEVRVCLVCTAKHPRGALRTWPCVEIVIILPFVCAYWITATLRTTQCRPFSLSLSLFPQELNVYVCNAAKQIGCCG